MNVNIYATSLLKHIKIGQINRSLRKAQLSMKTCYTLNEADAFKHDQGKALETVVIPEVQKTNADLVILENGVNEATKISRTGLNLPTMRRILRNRAHKLVDFAEKILLLKKDVAIVKMMPRFDDKVHNDEARMFLNHAHHVWNQAIEDRIVKKTVNITILDLINGKDIVHYSREALYGKRDGIHFSGKNAANILAIKLERELTRIMKQLKLDQNKVQDIHLKNVHSSQINPSSLNNQEKEAISVTPCDWNDIVHEDEIISNHLKNEGSSMPTDWNVIVEEDEMFFKSLENQGISMYETQVY